MEEKNEVKTLKEKLFTRREHGAKVLSKEEMKNSQDFSVGYKDFLNKSKTESEAVAYVLEKAKKWVNPTNPGIKSLQLTEEKISRFASLVKMALKMALELQFLTLTPQGLT